MATQAQYAAQPVLETALLVQASLDTSRSSPATSVEITAGPSTAAGVGVGKRITKITATEVQNAAGSAGTANLLRFWIEEATDTNAAKRLIVEKIVPAITPTVGTTAGFRTEVPELVGLVLPGHPTDPPRIYVSANSAATFHITVESALL